MIIKYHGRKYHWRFSKFIIHLLIIFSVLTMMITYITTVAKANMPRKEMTIIVQRGDNLWSLAQKIDPNTDPRLVIHDMKTQNNLYSSDLKIGQTLKLMERRD